MSAQLPIADAHQHFWDPRANYHPWLCDAEPIAFRYGDYAALRRPYLPADYFTDVRGIRHKPQPGPDATAACTKSRSSRPWTGGRATRMRCSPPARSGTD